MASEPVENNLSGWLLQHSINSVLHFRMTAVFLVAGIALTSINAPISGNNLSMRLDFGRPPILLFRIAYHSIAAWIAFLGVFWDVRKRMQEWALVRLAGGHPSLVAGFQYAFVSGLGLLIGGGISFLIRFPYSVEEAVFRITGIVLWVLLFSVCVSAGPLAFTEFFDVVPVIRTEGDVR
jgi:hypothetical protein